VLVRTDASDGLARKQTGAATSRTTVHTKLVKTIEHLSFQVRYSELACPYRCHSTRNFLAAAYRMQTVLCMEPWRLGGPNRGGTTMYDVL